MSEIIFSSQFYSLSSIDYRVRLYGKTYIGFDAVIIGGSGNVFYFAEDWTDYIENNQAITVVGASDVNDSISSFTYNSAQNRTEITLNTQTFGSQTSVKNDILDQGGFIPVFDTVIQNLVANYENSDDYILSPLMTSHIDITYANVRESRTEVDTVFFDRFIELYLQSNDDELRLTLERNDSGYELEWAGNIVMDLIEWGNDNNPRPYTFRAIDGINRLKDVPYNGDVTSLQNKKIKDIIIDVLALNGLDEFWGTTDTYLSDSIEYKSADVVSVNASDSPLDYTYVYENLLMQKNKEILDENVFLSGYDILYGLMEIFSARLLHTRGVYYIQQIRNYDTNTISTRTYVKGGTYAATAYTHTNNTLRVLAGGKFGYLYGIKKAIIESENKDVINVGQLPINQDRPVFFNHDSQSKLEIRPPIFQDIGNITGGLSAGQFAQLQFKLKTNAFGYTTSGASIFLDADLEVRWTIKDTTNFRFLKGSDSSPEFWGTGAGVADQYFSKKLSTRGNTVPFNETIRMRTPIIPFEMEDVEVSVEIIILNIRNTPLIAFSRIQQLFTIESVALLFPKKDGDNVESIYVDNPNAKFTKDLELGNLIINEGNSAVQANNLSVNANYNGGALDYKIGGLWNGSFDVSGSPSVLRVLEAMSLQFKPIRRYMGDWDGKYYPYQTIPYDNAVFAAKEVNIDFLMDNVSGEWFEVITSRVGLTSNIIGTSEVITDRGLGDAFVQSQNNAVGVGILKGDLAAATGITSINLDSTGDIKIGDKIQILGPSGDVYLELVSTQDLNSTGAGVTLSVVSFDLDVDIPSGTNIVYGYKKMYYSEKLRFDTLQHTAVKTAPTVLPDMLYNEVRVVGPDIWIKSGETIYKLAGVSTIV